MGSSKQADGIVSRRRFIQGAGTLAAAPLLTGLGGGALAAPGPQPKAAKGGERFNTRLVILGSSGGISWWPNSTRASSSVALAVGDAFYLIDLGHGSAARLAEAFNWGTFVKAPRDAGGGKIEDGSSTFLESARALFFTHLHQDHTADYPSFLLIGPGAGLGSRVDPATGQKIPFKVIGPCNRGQLEIDKTGFVDERHGEVIYAYNNDSLARTPTPGTKQMTDLIWQAFAQTINDVTLDDAYPDFRKLIDVSEIGTPLASRDSWTCPSTEVFKVYEDDRLLVKGTLVDHHQVYPSFAFSLETEDGVVVISGDTGANTYGNLQALAQGADILVHEVIDLAWVQQKFGDPPETDPLYALKQHMLTSHTPIGDVGGVATSCGVKTLVLYHIVPGNTPMSHLLEAGRTFDGKLIVSEDLMEIGVGKPRRR